MNHISRREFLSGAAALGLGGWRLFAMPPGKTLTIAARPLSSLGTSGKAISAEFKPCET